MRVSGKKTSRCFRGEDFLNRFSSPAGGEQLREEFNCGRVKASECGVTKETKRSVTPPRQLQRRPE